MIIKLNGTGYGHTTIPLLRKGKVGGQFWAAYMKCPTKEKNAVRNSLEQIDFIKRMIKQYNDVFTFTKTADEILQAHKNGKIASLIGKFLHILYFPKHFLKQNQRQDVFRVSQTAVK